MDHLGSTSTLTDASGSVIARERYSAFGERRRSDNLAITDQLYTGQQYNSLSNLYHYSDGGSPGRFYDPLLGRFVQPDPLLPHLASQGLNRYAPNYNNPLRYKDPDGHDPWDVINGANEFAQGFVSQWGYNNAVFLPPSQAQLAPREGESDAMTAGRVVGDVVSVGQAVAEGSGGAGLIAGGGTLAVAGAETGVGIVAGAAGVAVGAGMVVHAGSVATAAGSHIGIWMTEVQGRRAYRYGGKTARNLTPRPNKDVDGLSLSTTPGKGWKFRVSKEELQSKYGFVVQDDPTKDDPGHFLLRPGEEHIQRGWTLDNWAATRDSMTDDPSTWHELTRVLKDLVEE